MLSTSSSQPGNETLIHSRTEVIHSLRDLLNNGDEVDKCNASRALGSIGAIEAIDDLVGKLHDEDVDVCIDAAEALGKLNANQVVPQLIESLKKDPDGELKTAIVKSLGDIQSPVSIPILMEIAEQQPEGMIIDSNEDWDDWWDMQQQAVIALGKMKAEQATGVLKRLLSSDDVLDIEIDILKALVNIGNSGEAIVIEQLKSAPAQTRRRAAMALAHSTSGESLKSLASAFTDSSDDVRLNALQALVDRKASKYLSAIELLKRDRSEKVRQAALLAINDLSAELETAKPSSQANEHLLKDPDADVRSTYLKTLQSADVQMDDEKVTEHINTALNDKDEQVMLATIPLFLKMSDTAEAEKQLIQLMVRPKLSDPLLVTCIRTLAQLGRWNVNISRVMTRLVSHQQQIIRQAILQALMSMEKTLSEAELDSTQSKTPVDIINETLNGRVVLEVEVSSLLDNKPLQQAEAKVEEAGEDEPPEDDQPQGAMSTLESILQDSQRIERTLQESATSTETVAEEDPSFNEFHELVQHNITRGEWLFNKEEEISVARDVQRLAARMLSKLPAHLSDEQYQKIINSLLAVLNSDDDKLRSYAAESIAQIALDNPQTPGIEYAFGGLVTQFHNEQWDLKLACMKALAAIRNRAAIPILMTALDHTRSALRIQAILSITDLELDGDEILKNAHVAEMPPTLTEWVHMLIDILQDKEAGVRYSAVNNLKRCLLSDEISEQQNLINQAIEQIVQTAFQHKGGRTRDMAQVLKAIEPVQGTERLVQLLKELPTSYERRFAIEMLEEMYRTNADSFNS